MWKWGTDPFAVDAEGKSVMHMAAMRGGPEIVRWRTGLGADVNAVEGDGSATPLHLAAAHAKRAEQADWRRQYRALGFSQKDRV
ncbi:hypothetical protein CCAX7_32330 [Capsulimonas corticalis]|uniref:Uncharacterized protein n=1 Tax=Capsulimonas corticalis TaxID=2219043 RepID=A0A402D426_9BACT|nr:ankyrin repeat domain-containing protein [Capsulimonas corticalis]BDI31182.1 hypothetical protein CCAX7_32330 [Capsulimonas corticalis]